MNDESARAIVAAVRELIGLDQLPTIVGEAVDHGRANPGSASWKSLAAVINRMRIDGFAHVATRAPLPIVVPRVVKRVQVDSAAYAGLLGVWAESHSDLREAVVAFLGDRGVTLGFANIPNDLTRPAVVDGVKEHTAAFRGTIRGRDETEDAVRVMVFTVLYVDRENDNQADGRRRDTQSAGPSGAAKTGARGRIKRSQRAGNLTSSQERLPDASTLPDYSVLATCVTSLEKLDPESPEWARVNEFCNRILALAAAKQEEATAIQIQERVTALLSTIVAEHEQSLRYLGFDVPAALEGIPCLAGDAAVAQASAEDLDRLLHEYGVARDSLKAAPNVREEDRRRKAVDALLEQLMPLCEELLVRDTCEDDGQAEPTAAVSDKPQSSSPSPSEREEPSAGKTGGSGRIKGKASVLPSTEVPSGAQECAAGQPLQQDVTDSHALQHQGAETATVKSVPEAAQLALESDTASIRDTLLFALVREDDLAGAYWFAQSQREIGKAPAIKAELLAAAQGAGWLQAEPSMSLGLRDIAQAESLDSDLPSRLLGLATSLKAVLLDPQSGMLGWLHECGDAAARFHLQELVLAVKTLAERGFPGLRPEDFDRVAGAAERRRVREEAVAAAGDWVDRAMNRQPGYKRAASVWHALIGPKGALRELLTPVIENRGTKVAEVREGVAAWRDQSQVKERVRELQVAMYGRKAPVLEAAVADWLLRMVEETCDYAARWCSVVEREQSLEVNAGWLFERIAKLRTVAESCIPVAEDALLECVNTARTGEEASARVLLRTLSEIRGLLSLDDPAPAVIEAARANPSWPDASWWTRGGQTLGEALARRLLWVPDAEVGGVAGMSTQSPPMLRALLRSLADRLSLENATRVRVFERHDFRHVKVRLAALTDTPGLQTEAEDAHLAAREELATTLRGTTERIEQSVVDNILVEAQRSEYAARLEQMRPTDMSPDDDFEEVDFGACMSRLQVLRDELAHRRATRAAELDKKWQDLKPKLLKRTKQKERKALAEFVSKAVANHDLVVAGECIARLEVALRRHEPVDLGEFMAPSRASVFEAFKASSDSIKSWAATKEGLGLVKADIASRKPRAGIDFDKLNTPRRNEVLSAIDAWTRLKGSAAQGSLEKNLSPLLHYLGFDLQHREGRAITVRQAKAEWIHCVVTMSAGLAARPIPQFGSMANGSYDVICMWTRPGMEAIEQRVLDLGLENQPVIVLYLGHLNEPQRRELVEATRRRSLAVAVLDETLFLFLSRCFDAKARLAEFLACALQYATLNPYTPSVAGNVPPEIYFGREDMAGQLESQQGSCLVYGGRQLGKSALLRHVQRRFHNPAAEHYAAVEDIKFIGDPTSAPAADIWRRFHRVLCDLGLLAGKYRSADDVAARAVALMDELPERRLLVMFDEADNFLDADSRSDFSEVSGLKVVMERTGRRIKVVFAGLHQVQRFQNIPNQPLAHLGRPILVGPLEPVSARKLARAPLEALGYELDDASVLRILSYTNYHPGLIQLFAHELLRRLHAQPVNGLPRYVVGRTVIEDVYYQDVRESIRERFDWTLALDSHYQAIAWSMILDQMESHDGFSRTYSVDQVLRAAKGWWTRGFEGMPPEELRGLLTEMCGLGVLVESREGIAGTYRLRSPNLVRLMGTDEDIFMRLDELRHRPSGDEAEVRGLHRWLDQEGLFSPLTIPQERVLNQPRSGVALVFGSNALGLGDLEQAARTMLGSGESVDEFTTDVLPSSVFGAKQVGTWLRRCVDRNRGKSGLVVYGLLDTRPARELGEIVASCLDYCETTGGATEGPWMRALLAFPPPATWEWVGLPTPERSNLEGQAYATAILRPLDAVGIRQRLDRADKICSDEICTQVLTITGGCPRLMDEVLHRSASNPDVREALLSAQVDLEDEAGPFRASLRRDLGLEVAPEVAGLLSAIAELLPASQEELAVVAPAIVGLTESQLDVGLEYARRMSYLDTSDDDSLGYHQGVATLLTPGL